MPNHVTTEISAPAEVLDALFNDEGRVDFELLIPPPPNMEQGGCPGGAVNGVHANGEVCWYEWNVKHWGTKWNAGTVPTRDLGEWS